jgi:hypothetical protein
MDQFVTEELIKAGIGIAQTAVTSVVSTVLTVYVLDHIKKTLIF